MNNKASQVAAKWWANHLRNKAPLDNGDDSATGDMVAVMAYMLQEAEAQNRQPDAADRFEAALLDAFVAVPDDVHWFSVMVDYGPDGFLRDAARVAGVDLGMTGLPWKTYMNIIDGKIIKVNRGYGGSTEVIYSEQE